MTDVATGLVLVDRYEIGRQLGRGGAGSVWAAHDRVLDRTVAVKVVPDGAAAARLAREARATAGIGVQHVVGIYDVGQQDDLHFLVMELVDGVDLATLLRTTGPLPPDLVALVGRDVARGVAAVHAAAFVHRDVSPANVLVSATGMVKLTDLGIARRTDEDATRALTQAGTVVGTVDYLAPEQVEGADVTAASDVYAVGLLLHALCTGAAPFGDGPVGERVARRLAGPPTTLPDDVGPVGEVIARAVAREPADRPADGDELRRALARLVPDDEAGLRARLAERVAAARTAGANASPDPTEAIEAVAFPARRSARPAADRPARGAPAEPSEPAGAGAVPDGSQQDPVRATAEATVIAAAGEDRDATTVIAPADGDDRAAGATPRRDGLLRPFVLSVGGVIITVAVAAALLGSTDDGSGEGGGDPAAVPLAIAAVDDHDPLGGGDEHGDEIGRVADGDPDTAWDTEGYETAALGGLKSGVGFLVDLGAVEDVAAVELDLGLAGADVVVTVSEDRPAGDPTQSGIVLGTATDTSGTVRIEGEPVTGRWVAVWFTSLADDGARYRAEVAEVRVLGP